MRVLAVDHGQARIGLAISDAGGRVARPLQALAHVERAADAARVRAAGAHAILVGEALMKAPDPAVLISSFRSA